MRLASLSLLVVVTCVVACSTSSGSGRPAAPATQPATTSRTPLLAKDDARFEGPTFKNGCAVDTDCKVGGCSSEVCTAEEGVMTACVVHADQPRGASCGCLAGECQWYGEAGTATTPEPAPTDTGTGGAPQGMPCKDGKCAAGLSCVQYYGIAGPNGPSFTSCEIRCGLKGSCPEGQKCITIADGPGQVCRPTQQPQP
jgi:eight-cysteine-cluster-containing protein